MDETLVSQITTLIERVTRVEAKLDLSLQMLEKANTSVTSMSDRLTLVEAGNKAAHRRLDEIEAHRKEYTETTRWWIMLGIAIAGIISGIISSYVGR